MGSHAWVKLEACSQPLMKELMEVFIIGKFYVVPE